MNIEDRIAAAKTDRIRSRLILGTAPNPDTHAQLRATLGQGPHAQITSTVFEVRLGGAVRYCCWAGGALRGNEPYLTLPGRAAVESLMNLPFVRAAGDVSLIFQELKIGRTPLRDKVLHAFRRSADIPSVIAFVGDLRRDLDGHMSLAFNFDGQVDLADCVGLGRQRGDARNDSP